MYEVIPVNVNHCSVYARKVMTVDCSQMYRNCTGLSHLCSGYDFCFSFLAKNQVFSPDIQKYTVTPLKERFVKYVKNLICMS